MKHDTAKQTNEVAGDGTLWFTEFPGDAWTAWQPVPSAPSGITFTGQPAAHYNVAIDTLAVDCGLSRSATKRALNQLRVKGVIVCDGDRSGGRGRANRWRLIVKGGAGDTLSNDVNLHAVWPVDPKPPAPRVLRGSSATSSNSARETGAITICAMRSPRAIITGSVPKFASTTCTSPR